MLTALGRPVSPPENEDPELEVAESELEVDPLVEPDSEFSDPVLESVEVPVSEVTESLSDPVLEVFESVSDPVSEATESLSDPVLEVLESVPDVLEVLESELPEVLVPVSPPEVEVLVLTPVELVASVFEVVPELLVVEEPVSETPEFPLAEGINAPSAKSES